MTNNVGQINRLVPGLQNGFEAGKVSDEQIPEGKFVDVFGDMLKSVNSIQQESASAQELLATGEAADLHQVMIALEKAGIAMDLLLEIRNRLVEGYHTLVKMPM